MTCIAKLPIDEIIAAVKASIKLEDLGGVSDTELETLVLNYTQQRIDAIRQLVLSQAPERYVVAQGIEGYNFTTILNDGTVYTTDMNSLVGTIVDDLSITVAGYATKEEVQQVNDTLTQAMTNHLRVDAIQNLSPAQQAHGRTNLDVYSKAETVALIPTGSGSGYATKEEVQQVNNTLTQAVTNRLRVDAAQGLNTTQQTQGRENLGLGALATQNMVSIAQGGTGATTLAAAQNTLGVTDNKVLNPIKIGVKWYQPGLRYTSEYPRPYNLTTMAALSGYQIWVPFIALEDATIDSLEIICTVAVASSTVQLGLYASDGYNDLANALFISDAISCATAGAKTAQCNVAIQKGKVYWLSSLVIGTPTFYRNYSDSMQPIKGSTTAGVRNTIGYAIANMTTMSATPPANKVDHSNAVPRVAFTVS